MNVKDMLNEMAVPPGKQEKVFYPQVAKKINDKNLSVDEVINWLIDSSSREPIEGLSDKTKIKIISPKNVAGIEPHLDLKDEKVVKRWNLIRKELVPSGKRESNEALVNKRMQGFIDSLNLKMSKKTPPILIDFDTKGTKINLKKVLSDISKGLKRDQRIRVGRNSLRFEAKKASPRSLESGKSGVMFAELQKLAIPFKKAVAAGKVEPHNKKYDERIKQNWNKIENAIKTAQLPYLVVGDTNDFSKFKIVPPNKYELKMEERQVGKTPSKDGLKRLVIKANLKKGVSLDSIENLNDFFSRMEKHLISQNEDEIEDFTKEIING